ncbi:MULTISPECIES: transcriptional regulator [Thermococcus]|uniref:Predicted transcriptional regulator n=2 Tax=Thermococcus sibiricus TaxID=172049 RepID=C6A599_THESM|nr:MULTISPECIES: transcriptional regulator [Thermococcus]KUK28838.1 MAG: putative transcriptional regulator [Thermococcus sp. 40_45]HII66834.1 transcriptional regulator [Thermococcaceae archaeon]ACS90794.1 Predicted transcriptional regulator [Thermococcus sibiricus MM 739]KUK16902.1 MAG: putative transcriptional regulator [Thermococcus sibiricus]MBC7094185.1 transcriptional regulator [Thermococcus sp.]
MKTNAFEAVAKYVYPSLRRRLVEILREKGLNQLQIAKLLYITQSAVSRYLRMNRGALVDVEKFPEIDNKLKELAETIIKKRPDEYYIHGELVKITIEMLGKGYVCSFHSKVDSEIDPKVCRVCIEAFG